MKLKHKLLLLYGLCGLVILPVLGYFLTGELKKGHLATIESGIVKQLENLDFSLTTLIEDVKHGIRILAENGVVRSRDDQNFTKFLDSDEDQFEYHIGDTEQQIIDIFQLYRATNPQISSVYMGRENGSFVRSHKRGHRHSGLDPVAFQGDSRNPSGITEMLLDGIQLGRFCIPSFAGMTDEVYFHGKGTRT